MRPLVLFVDDNKTLVDSAKPLLEFEGFEVLAYCDAQEALDQAGNLKNLSCAVIDWNLPKISGHEFLRLLNEKIGTIPVIFISGLELYPDDSEPLIFMKKPFRFNALAEKIRSLL